MCGEIHEGVRAARLRAGESRSLKTHFLSVSLAIIFGLPLISFTQSATSKGEPGLAVTFESLGGKASDVATAPNIWLFVQAGKSAAPFLPAGSFTATWQGTISAELRSTFFFQAELNGGLKLEINGASVLETNTTGAASALSSAVQLHKGPNVLKAFFHSPAEGDAFLRVSWAEKGAATGPIPLAGLNHAVTAELIEAEKLRLGRDLFLDYRCVRCHQGSFGDAGVPELNMDAPAFEGIGSRRNYDWMARWIVDPKALRPGAHMPRLLAGPKAKEDAEAIAAYLASLKEEATASPSVTREGTHPSIAATATSTPLFDKFQCAVCHDVPGAKEFDSKKISLGQVTEKFTSGRLTEFLRAPEAHFAWTAMPNFKLSQSEAEGLASSLTAAAEKPKEVAAPTGPEMRERGKKLVQNSACLNCHTLRLENSFSAPKLADLTAARWTEGCLAAQPAADSKAPRFAFSSVEREALKAFGGTDRLSLARQVPAEFAERQARRLNCSGCHGAVDLVPPLESLGGKLRPEWAARFMAGEILYKPRAEKHPRGETWLEARMPAFKSCAKLLADGLAAQHGFAPQTPSEPPVDLNLAKLGQKLASKEAGFSCISCHAIGSLEAAEVFDSEGINLARAAERLLPDYYRRWLRSPASIDPQTKMPLYFDGGKSQLTDILDGDAEKQIDALWQYLRLGEKMPPPGRGFERR